MQPLFPYVPEGYPPKGRIWPQFGDEILEETLSISEGVRQNLQRKKDSMSDWHKQNMEYHGLAPRPADIPVPEDDLDPQAPDAPPPPQGHGGQPPLRRHPGQLEPTAPGPANLPPGPPDSGMKPVEEYYMGDRPEPRVELQGGLGRPPDAPGGAAPLRSREHFRTTQQGPGGLPHVANPILQSSGGPPPQPPGAGAVMVPRIQDPGQLSVEATSSQGPPRPPKGGSKIRSGPYGPGEKKSVTFDDPFPWGPQPEGMDSSASAPAPIVPMQEQNTVPKRPREEEEEGKKKKPAVLTAQSPPSLPPPPPGGAGILRPTQQPAEDNEDAQTVAYGDEEDDNQTVAYGEEEQELPLVSAAAMPPSGDHVPLLPIQSNEPDTEVEAPPLRIEDKKKASSSTDVLFPRSGIVDLPSRRLRQVSLSLSNQRVW
jgi:hypothetical protein